MTDAGYALGVMARAPVPGCCKTRLAAVLGDEGAASLYRAMLLDTIEALGHACAAASRLVVMAAPENDGVARLRALVPAPWEVVAQAGEGLGARLTAATRALGSSGATVALVSSDSPTVDWGAVGRAMAHFRGPGRVQMGPSPDGGYYLIALGAADVGVFEGIPWSTPLVQRETRARCAALSLALEELPAGRDVDDVEDLAPLREELRARPRRAPRTAAVLGGP
jgi:rSAM/selenodomain-associated transferase 1